MLSWPSVIKLRQTIALLVLRRICTACLSAISESQNLGSFEERKCYSIPPTSKIVDMYESISWMNEPPTRPKFFGRGGWNFFLQQKERKKKTSSIFDQTGKEAEALHCMWYYTGCASSTVCVTRGESNWIVHRRRFIFIFCTGLILPGQETERERATTCSYADAPGPSTHSVNLEKCSLYRL